VVDNDWQVHLYYTRCLQLTLRWLEAALKSLPNQTAGGTVRATVQQFSDFHAAISRYSSYTLRPVVSFDAVGWAAGRASGL